MSSGRIVFFLVILLLPAWACRKNPPRIPSPPAPTPAPSKLEIGNASFNGGLYREAAESYEAFVRENPDAANLDEVLFRLGIAYGLAGSSPENFKNTQNELRALIIRFPKSRYRPEAEYILTLQAEILKLRLNVRDRDALMLDRDERIRRLTLELERMKKIDLERRPTRPPR